MNNVRKIKLFNDIKSSFTNSKEFVNLVLGYVVDKSEEDKDVVFNEIVDNIAETIIQKGIKNE